MFWIWRAMNGRKTHRVVYANFIIKEDLKAMRRRRRRTLTVRRETLTKPTMLGR